MSTKTRTQHDDSYYLHRAPINRALVHLAIPMMAATSVGVVYNIINAGFIGALNSTALLAAVTFGLPLTGLVMAIGGVFGTGGSTAISRLLGERENADAGRAADIDDRIGRFSAFTVWGSLIVGTMVAVAGILFLDPIVRLLGADAAAFVPTRDYVAILLIGTPVMALGFAAEQLVRSEGAAKVSMIAIIASTVANLVLDVVLIFGLNWSVTGAALAIVGSNVVTVVYLLTYLHRHRPLLAIGWGAFRPDIATAKEVFGVGISELLMSGFLIVSSLLFNNVAVHYGDGVLAAFGVAQRIVQLPEMLAMGVCLGAMPLLATSFGAGRGRRTASAIGASAAWIAGLVVLFALPVFLFREQALTLFSTDPTVLTTGLAVVVAMLVAALFNGFTGLVITVFQATGQAGPATIMSVAQGVLFIPVLFGANAWFGLTGVIWAMTVTEVLCFLVAGGLLLLRGRRILGEPISVAQGETLVADPA